MTDATTPTLEAERAELQRDLLAFIRAFYRQPAHSFEELALRVVAYQRKALPAYANLFEVEPTHFSQAPLVPTELFRDLDLCSQPHTPKQTIFRTSGTTHGRRGQRRVPDLTLYNAAMAHPFQRAVLGGEVVRHRWVSFIPPSEVLPDSSLSHMISELAGPLGGEVFWCVDDKGLDVEMALDGLNGGLGHGNDPIIILTTAFALVEFFERSGRYLRPVAPGSRIMVTGGFKGKTAPIPEAELHAMIGKRLGIPPEHIISEYGMTELSSQAYGLGDSSRPGVMPLMPMPSLRFFILDPETAEVLPQGQTGMVACFDLLNVDNVSAILTSDLGHLTAEGELILEGRRPGAIPRGCGLAAAELIGN